LVDKIIGLLDSTSAAGIDHFSPNILKDTWKIRIFIPGLESNFIKILQIMINGRIPNEITKLVYACKLVAVIKKQENGRVIDIRPICIPTVLCRLLQNIMIHLNIKLIKEKIHCGQVTIGIKNGIEIMVNGIEYISNIINNNQLNLAALCIDYKNCF